MCGICGTINYTGIGPEDKKLIEKMNECLFHRGPDDGGLFFCEKVGMGHRRLSILDLSERGHQPMSYRDRYTIVFNGEIYNFIEIRSALEKKGYSFLSSADTEVILAAYDYYGIDCLSLFNGMWAFALWDQAEERMLLARDRFGVKPLYYYKNEMYFLFASEIKALLCDERIPRKANDKLVFDFLEQILLEHTDETFFKNIYKCPAGSFMYVDSREKKVECHRYYELKFSDKMTEKDPANRKTFKELFFKSVQLRLRSDVPTGSCLSGGLDSSAIVCAVDRITEKEHEQHTFSFCAEEKKIDEKEYMEEVVKETGVYPHYVYATKEDVKSLFEKLVYTQEEPFPSASIMAGYLVYHEAGKQGIKVLLDGQGADELLCGYRKSRLYYIKRLLKNRKYGRAFGELIWSMSQVKTSFDIKDDIRKLKRIFSMKDSNEKNRYLRKYSGDDLPGYDTGMDFQYNDVYKISLPVLLKYADRNSMAASVESRLPFLDYRFAEFCAGLPLSEKIDRGYSKAILRDSVHLPEKIRKRKDKLGFIAPEKTRLKKEENFFKGFFESPDFRAGRYIRREKVLEDWEKLLSGKDETLLFRMISLEAWMQKFNVQ